MNHVPYAPVNPDEPWTYPWVLLSCHHQDTGRSEVDIANIGSKCVDCVDKAIAEADMSGFALPFCDVCDEGWAKYTAHHPGFSHSLCETCYYSLTYYDVRDAVLYKIGWSKVAPKPKSV